MSQSHLEVIVYKGSSPAKGYKVSAMGSGGLTKEAWTDANGRAVIMTERQAAYTVYVDGRKRGEYRSPGQAIVYL
jgi:hypothetical protein